MGRRQGPWQPKEARPVVLRGQQLFEGSQDYFEIFDAFHSDVEDRFIAIGEIDRGIVVVVYTEREEGLIRIIGARFATRRERELYRAHMDQHR